MPDTDIDMGARPLMRRLLSSCGARPEHPGKLSSSLIAFEFNATRHSQPCGQHCCDLLDTTPRRMLKDLFAKSTQRLPHDRMRLEMNP